MLGTTFYIMKLFGTIVQSKKQANLELTSTQQDAEITYVSFSPVMAQRANFSFKAINNMLLPKGCEVGGEYLLEVTETEETYKTKEGVEKKVWRLRANVVTQNRRVVDAALGSMVLINEAKFGTATPSAPAAPSTGVVNTAPLTEEEIAANEAAALGA